MSRHLRSKWHANPPLTRRTRSQLIRIDTHDMKIEDLPTFTVTEIKGADSTPKARGKVNRRQWIGEEHICYLCVQPNHLLEGKFKDVRKWRKQVTFVPTRVPADFSFQIGACYPYFDGYWGERAAIVWDDTLQWQEDKFVSKEQGDHDHCGICWSTISDRCNQHFMKSSQNDVLCIKCFMAYVETKSIDFVEDV